MSNEKASLIIIDGYQGEGKTTLLVECMDYINSKLGHGPVQLNIKSHPQLAMGAEQFIYYLRMAKEVNHPIIGYDEAGDFNKRGAMTRLNSILFGIFSKFRGLRVIIILALPNFNVLDNTLFDLGVPRLLLHCFDRGENDGTFKGYSLKGMNWIRYWHDKFPKGAKHKAYDKVMPNFYGHFLDLSDDRSKKLDIISTSEKVKAIKQSEIQLAGLVNYVDIARMLVRSVPWVKVMVIKLKIKPTRKIRRVVYFDKSIVNILSDYLSSKTSHVGQPK